MNGNGLVMPPGQTLHGMFQRRYPLYQKYADLSVDCANCCHEDIVDEIISRLW
jgi:shikimate kinase